MNKRTFLKLSAVTGATALLSTVGSSAFAKNKDHAQKSMMRESGLTVTINDARGLTVHTLTSPLQMFANSTHIIETPNKLVLIDTQFFLPIAADYRAYADSLGKPIDRMFITHEHPDHFLGSEAFADVPMYALAPVAERIAETGQTEIDEKQGEMGAEMIASTFVVPNAVEPGLVLIDGVYFQLDRVDDAEAPVQMVIKAPGYGVAAVGDIVYSQVHLILAGQPSTWIEALQGLQPTSELYPMVLPGHGTAPTTPAAYDANIAYLSLAGELMQTAENAEEFKAGLVEAFPDRQMDGAIDFVTPMLFPDS